MICIAQKCRHTIWRASALSSAPNSDRFKMPLMRSTQMSLAALHLHWHGRASYLLVFIF